MAEVAVAVVAERGFEFGGMAPASDEVRVGVLLVAARAEEVVDQAGDAAATRADLADHWRIRFRTSSAAWSRSWARRMLFGRVGEQVAAALAGGVELGDCLVEVDADAADEACGADELAEGFAKRGV